MHIQNFKSLLKKIRMWVLINFKYSLIKIGVGCYFGKYLHIRIKSLEIGDYVFIGSRCHIASNATLGNFVMLASNVSLIGGDHRIDMSAIPMIFSGRSTNRPVIIEDDAWVGHGAIIMHGVCIGEGAIVAAGSVVTEDVPPYTIVGGNPAKKIRNRFSCEIEYTNHKKMLKSYRTDRKIDRNWKKVDGNL